MITMGKFKKKLGRLLLAGALLVTGLLPVTVKADETNTIQNAVRINENGSYSGVMSEDEEAFYRFDLSESGRMTVVINMFQGSDACLFFYDNEYNELSHWHANYDGNRACDYAKERFHFSAGTYYFKVTGHTDTSYSFTTSFESANETFPESQTNTNDILNQAKTISLEQTYRGLIGYGDSQDFYIFEVPFSGKVTVSHTNYTNGRSSEYQILDSEGNSLQTFCGDYDSNKGYAVGTYTTELSKGTYYLKACGNHGFYQFKITVKPTNGTVDFINRSKNKTKATVKIKKNSGVTGYIVQYSTSEKFTKRTTKTKTVKSTTAKLTGLNKNKTYYIRVRCYKVYNGKTYYGDYGDVARLYVY